MKPYFSSSTSLRADASCEAGVSGVSGVSRGFASAVSDFCEAGLDINDYLVRHRAASFYFTVEGDSMCGAGILAGDKVLVDRAVEPKDGHIVVAVVNSAYTLRRLHRRGKQVELRADNPAYGPVHLKENEELHVWGVVTGVVRKVAV